MTAPSATDKTNAYFPLLRYAKPFKWRLSGIFVLIVIFNVTQVLQPYLIKIAINKNLGVHSKNPHGIVMLGIFYLIITLIGLAANLIQTLALQRTGQEIVRKLRLDIFHHLESLSLKFFDRRPSGSLLTIISNDTTNVNQFFTNFLLSVLRDGLAVIIVMVAMLLLNWKLALLSYIVVPIIVLISVLFRTRLRKSYQDTRSRLSQTISFLAENLQGMRITQIFSQEPKQMQRFIRLNDTHYDSSVAQYGLAVLFNRTFEALGTLSVALMVWAGGIGLHYNVVSLGVLYAFIAYIQQFFQPINSLTQQWNTLQSTLVSGERIGRLFLEQPDITEKSSPRPLPQESTPSIVFDQVSFGYSPDQPIVRNITFSIKPYSFIGIVGATGAGKSTIMSLLARFYDTTSGHILVDSHDIREYRLSDLHRFIGIVQQDVHMFSGSILDNIRLFQQSITEDTVIDACKITGFHQFVSSWPQGYHTLLQSQGSNLSLGQRQLLSFSRALVFDPRILILDEATASLDSETEHLLQKGMTALSKGRTTLVIAHRLSTIRHADRILVMDKGELVEMGHHESLMAQHGHYFSLNHFASAKS